MKTTLISGSRPDIPILIYHSVSHWLHGVFARSFALLNRVRITPTEKLLIVDNLLTYTLTKYNYGIVKTWINTE